MNTLAEKQKYMNKYSEGSNEKSKAITDLRDTISTLKWKIWETMPILERASINGDE